MAATSPQEFVWGVDPAISHLAFAYASLSSPAIKVISLLTRTEEREGARLGLLDRQVRIFARQQRASHPPACVWVEQPSGRHRGLQLAYATGVIQAALFETLACPVWTIPSSAWKRRTVGTGNATKLQVAAWVTARWPIAATQDEADAIAIAAAGRAMLDTGEWETKAA